MKCARRFLWAWVLAGGALSAWAAPGAGGPSALPPSEGLLLGPYVGAVSETGARVHWVSPPGAKGACQLPGDGSGAKVELQTAPIAGRPEERHTAVITGLQPGQTHRYVVTAGGDRAEGSFQTPPPAGTRRAFSFATTSDTQASPSRHRQVASAILRDAPTFVIHTGDFTDDGNQWALWARECFAPARDLLRKTVLWPARGNHEKGAEPFASLFGLPAERPWYSFGYDNLHVVVLDQWDLESDGPMEPRRLAEMADWLEKDLSSAKARADWILVAGHQPMFNVAAHGSTWGHEQILPILYKHGVDVVTSGHSHLYERFLPIGPSGPAGAGGKPILFLVSGGGGGTSYAASPSPILAKSYSALHHCLFRIEGSRLELTVKALDGRLIDQVVLTKVGGALPREVTDAAIPPEDALRLLKPFKVLLADFPARPKGGEVLPVGLAAGQFPRGCQVRLARDPNGEWAVGAAAFQESDEPVPLKASPPAGVLLDENRVFSPMLTVSVSFDYHGRTFSHPSVPIQMTLESLRRLVPVPEPVRVASSTATIVVDGNLAEWKDVPYLALPSTKAASRDFRFTWRAEGLYGAVQVTQKDIQASPQSPWDSDGLELFLEADAQRRLRVDDRGTPLRMFLLPQSLQEGGKMTLRRLYGRAGKDPIQAAWRKTAGGYTMEFCIPATGLAGRLAADKKMGFHFHLRKGGRIVEQFHDTTPFRAVSSTPAYWGQILLVGP